MKILGFHGSTSIQILTRLILSTTTLVQLLNVSRIHSFQLTVLHYNDLHARFLPIDANGYECSAEEIEKQQCYGGFARLKGQIDEVQKKFNNIILLNAGDYFQGTLWFTLHGWELVAYFLNQLNHTAVTIGSHEFDDGVSAFVPFLENFKYPVISCNINDEQEPALQGKYQKSIVTNVGGEKVGIIGYTSEETKFLASPGMLDFYNIIDAVSKEAQILHDAGVRIIVGVGYDGIMEDQEICKKVPHLDIIVGGKSQVFLYTGTPPDNDAAFDKYPIVTRKADGKNCLVVTAAAFGKYLGFLQVEFDSQGFPIKWNGNPILLDNTVKQDEEIHQELDEWEANNTKLLSVKVGQTKVLLDGKITHCRLRECNVGNVLADSMVFMSLQFANDFQWNYASLAVINSGGIRGSIEEKNINGTVTLGDVYGVLPFRNKIDIVEMKGQYIRQMFEYSVAEYDADNPYPIGKFLQVSGFRIKYNFCQPAGSRLTSILARCNECRIPTFFPLENNSYYQVVIPRFLAQGGDGFTVIKDNILSTHNLGFVDSDILTKYMHERGPIVAGIEQRILIKPADSCKQSSAQKLNLYIVYLLCITLLANFI